MDDNFTSITHLAVESKKGKMNESCPKKETLDFIKRFARIVSCDPSLNGNLGVFIAN